MTFTKVPNAVADVTFNLKPSLAESKPKHASRKQSQTKARLCHSSRICICEHKPCPVDVFEAIAKQFLHHRRFSKWNLGLVSTRLHVQSHTPMLRYRVPVLDFLMVVSSNVQIISMTSKSRFGSLHRLRRLPTEGIPHCGILTRS